MCSGRKSCDFHVNEIVRRKIMPCPLELSAYMEASFHCLPSKFFFWVNFIFVNLQSFADAECSGKMSCQFHVTELVRKNFNPCPLELSSYLEASYICIPCRQNVYLCPVNLQSFADGKCSGKSKCEFFVTELVRHPTIRPCPLELASYLETAYICIPGTSLKVSYLQFFCIFSFKALWTMYAQERHHVSSILPKFSCKISNHALPSSHLTWKRVLYVYQVNAIMIIFISV